MAGATSVGGGGRWKSQNRKICASPSLCRKTFKLKGNKKARTWTKKSLRVFRISRPYVLCIYVMNVPCHHHHNIALVARISLTLSRHSSLSFIALGRSSGQHPVSSHSCWMYVRAGRPALARPCVGIYKSTSLMSSSLLLQQCPACLVRLTWIVFVIGGRLPYSWCLVGCCCQDLFRIASFRLSKWKFNLKPVGHPKVCGLKIVPCDSTQNYQKPGKKIVKECSKSY